mmetsp:Transcript_34686/g.111437  ORF Transcript_34686/g.111437 Transcript_34686/m.111437 type:complete len:203 (-) Transcript_34686:120-728(-)
MLGYHCAGAPPCCRGGGPAVARVVGRLLPLPGRRPHRGGQRRLWLGLPRRLARPVRRRLQRLVCVLGRVVRRAVRGGGGHLLGYHQRARRRLHARHGRGGAARVADGHACGRASPPALWLPKQALARRRCARPPPHGDRADRRREPLAAVRDAGWGLPRACRRLPPRPAKQRLEEARRRRHPPGDRGLARGSDRAEQRGRRL